MKNNSKVIRNSSFHWEGIERKEYKTGTTNFRDIHRYSLLGEAPDEFELNMHTRYFEIQPGGYSSLEIHRHPHSVVVIRGAGTVILGNDLFPIALHDVIYIAPETIHQFLADRNEFLGFLCVVDRYRDKPVVPDREAILKQCKSEKVLAAIRQ